MDSRYSKVGNLQRILSADSIAENVSGLQVAVSTVVIALIVKAMEGLESLGKSQNLLEAPQCQLRRSWLRLLGFPKVVQIAALSPREDDVVFISL